MTSICIAAAQICVSEDIDRNHAHILRAIYQSAKQGARFVCLPESCLVPEVSLLRSTHEYIKNICGAAQEHGINVIFGSYARVCGKIRNRVFVVSDQGSIVHRYDKRNLFMDEPQEVVGGKTNEVISLLGIPFAVINCWDYAFPEQIRWLACKGAKIIFCPAYVVSHPRTSNVIPYVPQVRAFDAMSYFVMVDAFAEDAYGRTRICHPLREVASVVGSEGIVVADIDLSEIDSLREEFPNLPGPVRQVPRQAGR